MKWRLLICSCVALILSLVSAADTLIVAGHSQQLTLPLVTDKGEVLAPLVSSLRLLGAKISVKGSAITITTPGHPVLKLTAGSTAYTMDGRKATFPVAPRLVEDELYLPVMALAPLLGASMQFDATAHTLAIHPLLDISYELRPEGLAILVRSAAPLQFTSGDGADPPRLYFDFKSTAIAAEQQVPVQAGQVERLRLAQYSLSPSTARLVIDCLNPSSATTSVEDGGRLVTIIVGKKIDKPIPPPVQPEVTKPLDPVKLLDVTLKGRSDKQSELTIATGGPSKVDCAYNKDTRQLTLTFRNGMNALTANRLRELRDNVVDTIEASGDAEAVGATLAMTLKQDAGFLVQVEPQAVRVLMGTFDIRDMTIVLDAGHGDYDSGAVGVNGTFEKNVNLDVVLRTGKLLEQAGATVIYTRKDDTFLPLNDRPGLANRRCADIFVSVHCNSMPRPNTASGTQTYYSTRQSARLAEAIHAEMIKGMGLKDGGVRTANFLVIRKSLMPSVLLELAFINNTREEALLSTPSFRQKAAEAIVNGIRRYAATKEWQLRKTEVPFNLGDPALAVTPGATN